MIVGDKKLGCYEIAAEGLYDGQTCCGMVAVNPFKATGTAGTASQHPRSPAGNVEAER